jgi:lysozyme
MGSTRDEAEYLLSNRLNEKKLELLRALPWVADLDEARRGVLFNMAYNLGVPGLLGFKRTLTLIKETMYAEAAAAMLQSKWAAQVGERAKRLSKQMETGQWI